MSTDEDFDAVWNRMSDATSEAATEGGPQDLEDGEELLEIGPPVRVTLVIESASVPVAPWAQGWRVAAAGPIEGHVTLLFEHDIVDSPVAQLAAVTGLLSTVKHAQLEPIWWAIQTRGPLPEG